MPTVLGSNEVEEDESSSIEVSNLKKHHILGTGELANVFLCTDTTTQKKYALKIFDKLHLFEHTAGFDAVKSLNREAQVLKQISSPFILRGLKTWQDKTTVSFLLPLIQGGELSKRLFDYTSETKDQGLPVDHALFYSACIAEALSHMHERNLAYRDLKPDNVMLDEQGYCVLIDLGFTKEVTDKTLTMCGTPGYVAPEQLKSGNRGGGVYNGHNKLVDWWSFAVVLYQMLDNATPFQFPGMHDYDTQDAIMIADYKCPEEFPGTAKELIDKLLVVDVTKRLGYTSEPGTSNHNDILRLDWFATVDFDKLRRKELPAPWTPQLKDDLDTSNFFEYDEEEEAYSPYRALTDEEQNDFGQFDWIES